MLAAIMIPWFTQLIGKTDWFTQLIGKTDSNPKCFSLKTHYRYGRGCYEIQEYEKDIKPFR